MYNVCLFVCFFNFDFFLHGGQQCWAVWAILAACPCMLFTDIISVFINWANRSLLDLSAAFDCVDHAILLQRLDVAFGLKDTVLQRIRSFLTGHTQQVAYCGRTSSVQPVLFGVPQWSVLGPLLYVLYTAELPEIVARHGLQLHLMQMTASLPGLHQHVRRAHPTGSRQVYYMRCGRKCLADFQQTKAE